MKNSSNHEQLPLMEAAQPAPGTSPGDNNGQQPGHGPLELQEDTRREVFAMLVTKATKANSPGCEVSYDRQSFQLRITTAGQTYSMYLAIMYAAYCSCDPVGRRCVIDEAARRALAGVMVTAPYSYAQAKASILPVIRPRVLFTRVSPNAGQELDGMARPLGNHLCVMTFYDLPTVRVRLTAEQLERWGVDLDTVFRDAMQNLLERTIRPVVDDTAVPITEFAQKHGVDALEVMRLMAPDCDAKEYDLDEIVITEASSKGRGFERSSECPGLYVIRDGAESTASMFLLDSIFRIMEVKGNPVVMVVNAGFVLVTGDEDPQGLAKMAELASEKLDDPDYVSATPIRLTKKGWETYLLPENHSCFAAFHRLHQGDLAFQYQVQGRRLRPIAKEFVAPYEILKRPDKSSIQSICTWTMKEPTFLPKTDLLDFAEMHPESHGSLPQVGILHAVVPWDAAMMIVGHRVARMPFNPPRFMTLSDPTPEEIEALKRANLSELLPTPGITVHFTEAQMQMLRERLVAAQREREAYAKLTVGKDDNTKAKSGVDGKVSQAAGGEQHGV